jgi:hypothetical protein
VSDFVIEEVLGQEDFSTANGDFTAYTVRFSGDQGNGTAQHNRKASSPAPVAGETIDAEIQHKNGKAMLKRLYKPPGGQSGGFNGGGRSPQDTKQIVRQHSQEMALRLLTLEIELGTVPKDAKASELLTPRIDWFQKDAES